MLETYTVPGSDYSIIVKVNELVKQAITRNASDVHLESTAQGLRVRYRIDGILYDIQTFDKTLGLQILSRVKILAHINIAEKRIPQDGKFTLQNSSSKHVDLRVSTFPSVYGEKAVIRILDKSEHTIELETLGLQPAIMNVFKELIQRSHGFFLTTGPTGSGKTTTLYAALSLLHSPEKNIITLEDPVEYTIDGITQGQIHPEAGFTFERGIRSLLRQDPDIAMIGEIRDKQTARIAIEAALTGHLVISTLHTNDACSSIMRLMDMGIEPFLINASLTGVLAQRLIRKICNNCKEEKVPNAQELQLLEKFSLTFSKLFYGAGCANCFNLGYKGRIGIFELLPITNDIRSLIVTNPHYEMLYQKALHQGMKTLRDDASQKLADGIISLQEFLRVTL